MKHTNVQSNIIYMKTSWKVETKLLFNIFDKKCHLIKCQNQSKDMNSFRVDLFDGCIMIIETANHLQWCCKSLWRPWSMHFFAPSKFIIVPFLSILNRKLQEVYI